MAGTKIIEDGIWTWFNTPSALYHDGSLYVGSWPAFSQRPYVTRVDLANGDVVSCILNSTAVETDDHDNPGLAALASGNLFAAWSTHNGDSWCATTSSAGDVRTFGAEVSVNTADNDSYAQVMQASDDDDTIFWFFRRSVNDHYMRKSTDEGATWGTAVQFFTNSGERPYFRHVRTSGTRFDHFVTNGQPNETTNSLYHFYSEVDSDGLLTFYKSDGTLIGDETDLPLGISDCTQVYDGTTNECWIWDGKTIGGVPCCVFAVFTGSGVHEYWRGVWNGSSWTTEKICDAGTTGTADYLYAAQEYYSGGVCLDPLDEDIVYVSREYGATDFRVEKWVKSGSWAKTDDLSGNTSNVNARPVAVDCGGTTRVLWWSGTYTTYTDYNTDVFIDGGITFRTAKVASPALNAPFCPHGARGFLPLQDGSGAPTDLMGNYTPSVVGSLTWNSTAFGYNLSGFATTPNAITFDSAAAGFQGGAYPRWLAVMISNTNTSQQCPIGFSSSSADNPLCIIRINQASARVDIFARNDAGTNVTVGVNSTAINDGNPHVIVAIEFAANSRHIYMDGVRLASASTSVSTGTFDRGSAGLLRRASNTLPFLGNMYAAAFGWGGAPNPADLCRDWLQGNFSGTVVPSSGGGARRRRLLLCGAR